METQLLNLGFTKNTKIVRGYRPHFAKGKDVLFIIGADFFCGKLYRINNAFKDYEGKVYGVLTDQAPNAADKDWVTAPNLILLKLDPLSIGQWCRRGMTIEYKEIDNL